MEVGSESVFTLHVNYLKNRPSTSRTRGPVLQTKENHNNKTFIHMTLIVTEIKSRGGQTHRSIRSEKLSR